MKDLIREIVQALVDQPENASVSEIVGENTNVLEVKVAKSDMGKISVTDKKKERFFLSHI